MAIILDGKKFSLEVLEDLKEKVRLRPAKRDFGGQSKKLKLVAVLVGDDRNSRIFLRQKEKACNFVGVDFELYQFPENIAQKSLEEKIKSLRNKLCHGIIIQLPLPKHIDTQKILDLIPAGKDVDLLSGASRNSKLLPPVLAGILELFKKYKIEIKGPSTRDIRLSSAEALRASKKVAVVGRGRLVGKPVADWMKKNGAFLTENTKEADILISGVGKPGLITGDMIKKGAVVIDAGGDVDQKSVISKAGYLTPVPGGVGPMTVAMVIRNLILLNTP